MITVICPTYNESDYLENIIRFFLNAQPEDKELLIVDGGSHDGTRETIKDWMTKYENIRLIDNPQKYVPFALNKAIKMSSGDPIIRLDAHTEFSSDYFEKVIETFDFTGADVVGGPMRAVGKSNFQKAVAIATGTVFGVGDSKIHKESYSGESDHVYLGAWKRKLFDEIGFFDERLKRNQDDEFHYRARSMGKKIYLNTKIKSFYYPRNSIFKLIKQYFQYGLFKPLVLKKIKSEIKLRHLAPSIFCIYILGLPITLLSNWYLLPLFAYIILNLFFSLRIKRKIAISVLVLIIYPAIHISYGWGFITGIFKA